MIKLDRKRVYDKSCATVVFLLGGEVVKPHFYLAPKKQDIHTDSESLKHTTKWNGYGGKWRPSDKCITTTAVRELYEESGGVRVRKGDLRLAAQVEFFWPGNTSGVRDMEVFFFTTYEYTGNPVETKEMGMPKLFSVYDAPYKDMMPADGVIIPLIMSHKTAKGRVYFTKNESDILTANKELIVTHD